MLSFAQRIKTLPAEIIKQQNVKGSLQCSEILHNQADGRVADEKSRALSLITLTHFSSIGGVAYEMMTEMIEVHDSEMSEK